MRENERDKILVENIRKVLDEESQNLNPAIQSRLSRIRHEAVESRRGGWRSFFQFPWIPRTVYVAVSIAILAGLLYAGNHFLRKPGETLEDLDLLASTDALEFYEDLDFYAWLAEEEGTGQNAG